MPKNCHKVHSYLRSNFKVFEKKKTQLLQIATEYRRFAKM